MKMSRARRFISGFLSLFLLFSGSSYTRAEEFLDPFDKTRVIRIEDNRPKEHEIRDARFKLTKKGVRETLVQKIPSEYIISYSEISDRYEAKVIERAIELHDIYGEEMSPFLVYQYVSLMNGSDNNTIGHLRRLKNLYPDKLSISMLGEHLKILSRGVPLEVICSLPEEDVLIWDRVCGCFVPDNLAGLYNPNPWQRSVKFASEIRKTKDYRTLKEELIRNISNREHRKSNFVEHIEDVSQLRNIDDPVLISLIKGYYDFFSNKDNVKKAARLLRGFDDKRKIERVAVVGFGENEYVVNPVIMDHLVKEKGFSLASEISCYFPPVLCFIEKIGIMHTHVLTDGAKVQIYPSPSGCMREPFFGGDSLALSNGQRFNPYQIDCVLSELEKSKPGESRINIDLMFRRVKYENGKPVNFGDMVVVDLGVYEIK